MAGKFRPSCPDYGENLCHIAAYWAIHEIRKKKGFDGRTMVGVANHPRVFDPYSKKLLDFIAAKLIATSIK